MTDDRFSQRLNGLFEEADREIRVTYARLQLEAARNSGLSNSGFGLLVIREFEAILGKTVNDALKSYDRAANAPRGTRQSSERADQIRERVASAVAAAVQLAQPQDQTFRDPWPAIVKRDAPEMQRRVIQIIDQHLTGLADTGIQHSFEPWWKHDWRARLAIGLASAFTGAVITTAVQRALPAKDCAPLISAAAPKPLQETTASGPARQPSS